MPPDLLEMLEMGLEWEDFKVRGSLRGRGWEGEGGQGGQGVSQGGEAGVRHGEMLLLNGQAVRSQRS